MNDIFALLLGLIVLELALLLLLQLIIGIWIFRYAQPEDRWYMLLFVTHRRVLRRPGYWLVEGGHRGLARLHRFQLYLLIALGLTVVPMLALKG